MALDSRRVLRRSLLAPKDLETREAGWLREGVVVAVRDQGDARVRLRADGSEVLARIPQHVSRSWLCAAQALGAVEVVLAPTDGGRWVVWSVFPSPEHEKVAPKVEISGSDIRLRATRSVEIECGPARVCLKEDGEASVRGKEVLSRASGINRIKGGAVRIN